VSIDHDITKAPVSPNGDAAAFVQLSENLSARCGSPWNTSKTSLPVKACTQRPHSVHTASTRRSYGVIILLNRFHTLADSVSFRVWNNASALQIKMLQDLHDVCTTCTWRAEHNFFIASMTLLQRAKSLCSVFTARSRRVHGALKAHTHTAFSWRP